jgi:hypothetical protein
MTVNWKLATGEFVQLTAAQIMQMVMTVKDHIQKCFDWEAQTKAQILAAETVDQLNNIATQIKEIDRSLS